MMDAGVFLSLPTESIAVRFVIASLVAALLARVLLRIGLRVPGVRAATAVIPAAALVIVTALFWGSLHVPWLMLPVEAINALPIKLGDTYYHVAPIALPLVAGTWAAIAGLRIAVRCRALLRAHRKAAATLVRRTPRTRRVIETARRVAADMRLPVPPTAVVSGCAGGASIVGIRRPVLVVDEDLVTRLDDLELQGVIAHELAHIRRRDNLMAFVLGIVRDLAFFVPGGRWALRQLHAERELAADQLAVRTTRRPGALASGLLKVLDGAEVGAPCAALVPRGTLVGRVEQLIDPQEVTPVRSGCEMLAVAVALALAIGAAVEIPAAISGDGDRYALAIFLQSVGAEPASGAELPAREARAFQVYRDAAQLEPATPATTVVVAELDDHPSEMSRRSLHACADVPNACVDREPSARLGIEPVPVVRMPDNALVDRWRAKPLVTMEEGIAVYWLEELR